LLVRTCPAEPVDTVSRPVPSKYTVPFVFVKEVIFVPPFVMGNVPVIPVPRSTCAQAGEFPVPELERTLETLVDVVTVLSPVPSKYATP
jgi:hypothetical protein